jgi:glycosyltransferase involved in cell wall biosynthesis
MFQDMDKMAKISIIIPTLNEEKYLPKLLESLKKQSFRDFEIIVSDAGSNDKTAFIAQTYGARVVRGGLPGVGRNSGARAAMGEFLFFLDADVILPRDFMENAYREIQDKFYDLASCEFRPLSTQLPDRIIHRLIYTIIRLERRINPEVFGFCILVSRRLFDRLGGFDESVVLAEDCEFVKRASKFRSLQFLDTTFVRVSVRRFVKEGRISFMLKGLRISMYRMFKGEIRSDIIRYEFGNFDKKRERDRKKYRELVRRLHLIKTFIKRYPGTRAFMRR